MALTNDGASGLAGRRARRRTEPSRSEQREQAILDAGEGLLTLQRLETLSMGQVAAAAGVSRSALYFYFGSLQELSVAVIERALEDVIGQIEAIEPTAGMSPTDVLELGLEATRASWRDRGPLLRTAVELALVNPAIDALWRRLLERGIDLYVALMDWAASDAGNPPPDPATARRHAELVMLMVGYAFNDLAGMPHTTGDEANLVADLATLIGHALQLH